MNAAYAITSTEKKPWAKNTTFKTSANGPTNLSVTDNTEQEWHGFGGCFNELGWRALSHIPATKREAIVKDFFDPKGCNFNYCRMPIGANDYSEDWYSLNEQDGDFAMKHFSIERDRQKLIPYIKTAQKYRPDGFRLFASPWSPPVWMKYPKAYNYGTFIMEEAYLKAYALYFSKFVKAYAQEGIAIDAIHVQNEPVSSQKFPSCVWTGEEFRTFIRDYLGPHFKKQGIDADIWLGTINAPENDWRSLTTRYNDYANLVLDDDKARAFIAGVSYQWAGKQAVQRTHTAWPELALMQSENECGDGSNSWTYATYVFDLFYHYLTNGVNSYIYWNMVLETGGLSTWGWNQNSLICINPKTKAITYNPEYYLMKHFSQFIQPGSRRVVLEQRWAGNAVAFRNDDSLVVVMHNPFSEVKTVTIGGKVKATVTMEPKSFTTVYIPQ